MKIKQIMEMSSKHWFEKLLDKVDIDNFNSDKEGRAKSGTKHFRPSEAHYCPRALWYSRMGYVKSPPSVQGLRRMSVGTIMHQFVDERLIKSGQLDSSEVRVGSDDDDPPIVGSYDAIVRNENGELELAEFKSYADPKPNSKYRLSLPKSEHVIQWNLYSYLTGIMKGFLFYMNKNTQQYKIYNLTRNERVLNDTLSKFKDVDAHIKKGKIYPYQPNENHDWCDFQSQCENDYFMENK